jgi:hypothetical protein
MIYKLSKTSSYTTTTNSEKPCDEAIKRLFPRFDVRTCTEDYYNIRHANGKPWKSIGTNHLILANGYIQRQLEDTEEWSIEINTLEELNAFSLKYGNLIINAINALEPFIEIYDDYRE